jgi:hypothetical protein
VRCSSEISRKQVFVLDLNEVNLIVLQRLIDTDFCPNFKRLQKSHVWVETSTHEADSNLEPRIHSVTVHTGLTQESSDPWRSVRG